MFIKTQNLPPEPVGGRTFTVAAPYGNRSRVSFGYRLVTDEGEHYFPQRYLSNPENAALSCVQQLAVLGLSMSVTRVYESASGVITILLKNGTRYTCDFTWKLDDVSDSFEEDVEALSPGLEDLWRQEFVNNLAMFGR